LRKVLVKAGNQGLAFKIPDFNSGISGSAEPISVGGEDQAVNNISSIKGVEHTTIVQVPEHSSTVLSSGSTEGTIRGDSNGVNVTSVSLEGTDKFKFFAKGPDFNQFIPTSRDNHRSWLCDGGKLDAGDPISMSIINGEFTFTKGVPETDGSISGARHDLSVVGGKGNRGDVFGVANKLTVGLLP